MTAEKDEKQKEQASEQAATQLSTGAGMAIAGIWFSCTLLTVFLLWWSFVHDRVEVKTNKDAWTTVIAFILCLVPVLMARDYTKKILGR